MDFDNRLIEPNEDKYFYNHYIDLIKSLNDIYQEDVVDIESIGVLIRQNTHKIMLITFDTKQISVDDVVKILRNNNKVAFIHTSKFTGQYAFVLIVNSASVYKTLRDNKFIKSNWILSINFSGINTHDHYYGESHGNPSIKKIDKSDGPAYDLITNNCKCGYFKGRHLDIGCGSGYHCFMLAEFPELMELIGIYISERSIEAAKKEHLNENTDYKCKFKCGNILDEINQFDENSFDSAHSFHTFEHFWPSDLDDIITGILRVLKPSGFITIIVPLEHNHESIGHKSWFTIESLCEVFTRNGFEIEVAKLLNSQSIVSIYRKPKKNEC